MKRRILAIILLVAILFTSFASVSFAGTKKETGLYKVDGKWKYYENGKFTKATGLVMKPTEKTWHYVENGVYKRVTGLVKCVQPGKNKGKWFYVYKGDFNKKATGMVKCVQPGKSKGEWYYVKNGKINKKTRGLVKCIQPGSKSKGKWYYVRNGKLKKSTGYTTNTATGKKCYVKNGKWAADPWYKASGQIRLETRYFVAKYDTDGFGSCEISKMDNEYNENSTDYSWKIIYKFPEGYGGGGVITLTATRHKLTRYDEYIGKTSDGFRVYTRNGAGAAMHEHMTCNLK